MSKSDGMIVGSWFKFGHNAYNMVNEAYVEAFMETIDRVRGQVIEP